MRRGVRSIVWTAFFTMIFAGAETAFAQYEGCPSYNPFRPSGSVSPRGRTPTSTPTSTPTATPGPGLGGGVTPGPQSPGGATPQPGVPLGGFTPRKPRAMRAAGGFDWQEWWNSNSGLFLYGVRHTTTTPSRKGGQAQTNKEETIAALQRDLSRVKDPMLRGDCALTLGRMGHDEGVETLLHLLEDRKNAGSHQGELIEAVAMGLAHTGRDEAVTHLCEVVAGDGNRDQTRGIAAAALGVLGEADQETVRFLMEMVSGKQSHDDLRVACAMALGSMGGSYGTEFLLKELTKKHSAYVKAHLLTALSLTSNPVATEAILKHTVSRENHVRFAALLAIGGLLDGTGKLVGERADDSGWPKDNLRRARRKASAQLRTLAENGNDDWTRAFATLSLGRIGGRKNQLALEELAKSVHGHHRSAVVLALALADSPGAEKAILRLLHDESEIDEVRAAACAAVGILRHAAPLIRRAVTARLARQSPGVLRYYACVGLGLLGDHTATSRMKNVLFDREEGDFIRLGAAQGLSLLGTSHSIKAIRGAVEQEKDAVKKAAILSALGSCPSQNASAYLMSVIRSDSPLEVRIAATHALGHVENDHRPPLFAKFLSSRNYFFKVPPLVNLGSRL